MKTELVASRRWKTRTITVTGLLGAATVVLAVTPLGFIPVPTAAGHATIMHVPVIIGGLLEGPLVGTLTGLIFGLYSFLQAANPLFKDPLIAILPRILIGLAAYVSYRITENVAVAAVLGTAVNTIGVMGLAVLRGYIAAPVALGVALTHGLPEVFVAVAITLVICKTLKKFRR